MTISGGWLSGGPHDIGGCGFSTHYDSLPLIDPATGLEVLNYRPYDIDWTEPLGVCTAYHAEGMIGKVRNMNCPPGHFPWQGYCVTTDASPPKNLGDGGRCSMTDNPIHIKTGNKFQEETDYAGTDGLQFKRFYNHGGVHETTAPSFGGNWFTQIGRFWRHSYDRSISLISSSVITTASVYRPDGQVLTFNLFGTNYLPDQDVNSRLEKLAVGWRYTTASNDVELYDEAGLLTSITFRTGLVQTMGYSHAGTPSSVAPYPGLLISVTDSFGRQLAFTYNSFAQLVTMTDAAGGVYQYQYNSAESLVSVTYPDTKTRTYVYNEPANTSHSSQPGALTGIIDENNSRFSTYQYHSDGRAIGSFHAGGVNSTSLVFNANGTTTVTDALGQARTHSFNETLGTLRPSGVSQPCPQCASLGSSRTFDANGNLDTSTDFNGNVTDYTFDLTRNLETSRTEAFGTAKARTITTTWHPTFRLPATVTEPNRTTTFTRDGQGNVLTRTVTDTSVTPNVSRTWTYTYNAFGKVLTENGPRTDVTDVTTYTYYTCTSGAQCGQVHTITNALSHVTTFNAYNSHGRPTQITDANGLVTSLAYDARQRLTDRCTGGTLPGCVGGELTHLDYWPTGLLKKATNPDGSFIEYTYDAAHRLTEIKDGANNKIVYTLDNAGNRTAENTFDPSNALKRTHSRVFNALNQLWKDVNAAGTAAVTTTFGYDANGNQTTTAAPLGRNSTNFYDELNRVRQITDPASGNTQFGYDANDNLTSVTDPRNLVTSYTYTGFGDLKTQTSPDTGLTTNTFDSGGNLKTSTDARNAITTYNYDALNRVTSAAFKIGSTTDQTITYTYDAGTNGKGRLTGASDSRHTMSWTYDSRGRVTGKSQVFTAVTPNVTHSLGYGYNASGQLASMVYPTGRTIQYTYNANNQVTSVTLLGSPNVTIVSNITYDPFGPVTGWTWGNGTASTTRSFDTDGKLTSISNVPSAVGTRTFGFDDAFRITSATDSATGGPSWTFGYDNLDRLNSALRTGTTIGYTYDANGNRLTQTGTSASTHTVSGSSNRLSSVSGALTRTYTYDAVGNTLTSGATVHTYNNRGRMKSGRLASTGTNTNYDYNALGQRYRKGGGTPGTVYFAYDEAGHLVGEYNSTASLTQETVWLGDIPIATLRANGSGVSVFYVHTDQLNTPRKVTSTSNVLRWRWDPTPFGEGGLSETPTSGQPAFKYNLRFPGQYFDLETSLNYNYFRNYDPLIGRYIESDPTGMRGGINTFSYARAAPTYAVDPQGLFAITVVANWSEVSGHETDGPESVSPWLITRCKCFGCGDEWRLRDCKATVDLRVSVLTGLSPSEYRCAREAGADHITDFRNATAELKQAGEAAEAQQRQFSYSDKATCERSAIAAIEGAMLPILERLVVETRVRWDISKIHRCHNSIFGL